MLLLKTQAAHSEDATDALSANMTTSITMIATANIITKLSPPNYNRITNDMNVAKSGAQTYVQAEKNSTYKFRKIEGDLSGVGAKISNGKQSEAFCDLQNSYEDVLKVLENKLKMQKAAATAFSNAAAIALKAKESESPQNPEAEGAQSPSQFASCAKKIEAAYAPETMQSCGDKAQELNSKGKEVRKTLTEYIKVREEKESSMQNDTKTKEKLNTFTSQLEELEQLPAKLRDVKHPSCGRPVEGVKQSCKNLSRKLTRNQSFSKNPSSSIQKTISDDSFAKMFLMGSSEMSAVSQLGPELAVEMDKQMFSPEKRAALWKDVRKRADEAIRATEMEIEKVKSNLRKIPKNITVKNEYRTIDFLVDIFITSAYAEDEAEYRSPCLASPGYTDCTSMTNTFLNTEDVEDMPANLKNISLEMMNFSDHLSGARDINRKLLNEADEISKKDAIITKFVDSYRTPEQDKAEEDLRKRLNAITKKVLERNNLTPKKFLAGFGKGIKKSDEIPKDILQKIEGPTKPIAAQQVSESIVNQDKPVEVKSNYLNINSKKYKLNDINNKNEDSIFDIISNRYFKSGYNKLKPSSD